MQTQRKYFAIVLSAALVACGGGGDSGPGQNTGPNALAKYIGTYTVCDDHDKSTLVIAARDSASVSITQNDEYYQNPDCTGALLATDVMSAPLIVSYVSTGVATVTGWPASNSTGSYEVDRVEVRAPAGFKTTLTGSGVVTINGQQCIRFSPTQTVCFGPDPDPSQVIVAGFTFTSNALLLLSATPTGYERDWAFPR